VQLNIEKRKVPKRVEIRYVPSFHNRKCWSKNTRNVQRGTYDPVVP
jgi:hypothetical protein